MIKHGEYHVSVDTSTSKLFLSKSDPHLTLCKYSDGTFRNEKGDKCLSATGKGYIISISSESKKSLSVWWAVT